MSVKNFAIILIFGLQAALPHSLMAIEESIHYQHNLFSIELPTDLSPQNTVRFRENSRKIVKLVFNGNIETAVSLSNAYRETNTTFLEVFQRTEPSVLTIAISKYPVNEQSLVQLTRDTARSVARYDKDAQSSATFRDSTLGPNQYARVDVFPSYGDPSLRTSFLFIDVDDSRFQVLIQALDKSGISQAEQILAGLRFTATVQTD